MSDQLVGDVAAARGAASKIVTNPSYRRSSPAGTPPPPYPRDISPRTPAGGNVPLRSNSSSSKFPDGRSRVSITPPPPPGRQQHQAQPLETVQQQRQPAQLLVQLPAEGVLEALNQQRAEGDAGTCDLLIQLHQPLGDNRGEDRSNAGATLYAHRAVVAAGCPYLGTLLRDAAGGVTVNTHLMRVSPPSRGGGRLLLQFLATSRSAERAAERHVETVVDYLYGQLVTVTSHNVEHLLRLACELQLEELTAACAQFVREAVSESDMVSKFHYLYQTATAHSVTSLLTTLDKFISRQINHVTIDQLDTFLSACQGQDTAGLKSEQFYDIGIRWLKYDVDERRRYLSRVMSHIDFSTIDDNFIRERVSTEPLLLDDNSCLRLLVAALRRAPDTSHQVSETPPQPQHMRQLQPGRDAMYSRTVTELNDLQLNASPPSDRQEEDSDGESIIV